MSQLHSPLTHRRLDIQGLRAIAVLVVVAFHAGLPIPGGFVGVDVFFVISGFVITAMLEREWVGDSRISFGRFYLRRFRRLGPAMALMISVTLLISAVVLSPFGPQQIAAQTAIGAILMIANLVINGVSGGYFDAPTETNPLLNTWSLSVEEQFYLAFPLILLIGWTFARRQGLFRFSPWIAVSLVAVVSFGLTLVGNSEISFRGSGTLLGFYSPFTRAWEFAVGSLLALAIVQGCCLHIVKLLPTFGVLGFGMLCGSFFFIDDTMPFPGPWTLLPVVGTALLLLAGTGADVWTTRFLSQRFMVAIGDWSYSIYLWHWPFIVFALILWPHISRIALFAAIVSFIPALLSYHLVEQPIRNKDALSPLKKTALILVTVFVPISIAVGVILAANQYWKPKLSREIAGIENPQHKVYTLGCDLGFVSGDSLPTPCKWNEDASGPPVYLVGDSNAAHFVEGLIEATSQLDRPLIVTTGSSCPFLDLQIAYSSNADFGAQCAEFSARLLDSIVSQPPGTVIIAQSDGYWVSADYAVLGNNSESLNDANSKIRLMAESLSRTIMRLQLAGNKVIVIQTVPHFFGDYEWTPEKCSLLMILSTACSSEMPLEAARERSDSVINAVNDIGAQSGATIIDLASDVCPDDVCISQNSALRVYRDSIHISVPMSLALSDRFKTILHE